MGTSGVYSIKNTLRGKEYIGSSVNIDYRWNKQHIPDLRTNKHDNIHLQNAWNKYGETAFQLIVLEICAGEQLLLREQHHINSRSNNRLYNISKFVRAPFRGQHHSVESKTKISVKLKGRTFSDTHRANLSKSQVGKQGQIAWNKGIPCAADTKQKISITKSTKLWKFIDPVGRVHEFYNLTKFCKEHNLRQGMMWEVSVGRLNRTQHKGWRLAK